MALVYVILALNPRGKCPNLIGPTVPTSVESCSVCRMNVWIFLGRLKRRTAVESSPTTIILLGL
jgi:hypothetical protein